MASGICSTVTMPLPSSGSLPRRVMSRLAMSPNMITSALALDLKVTSMESVLLMFYRPLTA